MERNVMIVGFIFAIIAGALVSLQNIFNSKVNEQLGSWYTTTLVLGMGFFASLCIGLINEGQHFLTFKNMKLWYWFSGVIGVGVVTCLVHSIRLLGPTYAISIVLASQLVIALLWDSLGLLGIAKIPFTFNQLLGVMVIVGGIIVFKFGGLTMQ